MNRTGNATAATLPPCRDTPLADEFVPGARSRNGCWSVNTPERFKS